MQVVVSTSVTFDAGHRTALPPLCSLSPHGHRWEVRAVAEAPDLVTLMDQLQAIASELQNRDLGEMLPGVPSTPAGIAAYVRERINLGVPTLVSVSVDIGMWAATVMVERR